MRRSPAWCWPISAWRIFNHLVEGVFRDPASLNKPSTYGIGDDNMLGTVPWLDVHPGIPVGVLACVLCWVLIYRTGIGFAGRVTGGNIRAAQLQGLPVAQLIVLASRSGWRLRGPRRHHRGRRGTWPRQRLAGGGVWLYRHPHRLPGALQSAGDHADGGAVGRARRGRRSVATAHGIARRHGAGAARA